MLTFLAPQFWFALPLALLPLLFWWRRREAVAVRRWSAMAILVRAARQTPWYRKRDIVATTVRVLVILAMIAVFAQPHWTPRAAVTVFAGDTASPHIARALRVVHRPATVARPENVSSPAVLFLGDTTDGPTGNFRIQRRDFATPREVTLYAEDAGHPITAPFAAHLEKFRVTLRSVWEFASSDLRWKPVLVAEDAGGERFTIISESVSSAQERVVLWHTSPEDTMSSLGKSPLFPALLDTSLHDLSSCPKELASSLPRIAMLVLVVGLLAVDTCKCSVNRSRS